MERNIENRDNDPRTNRILHQSDSEKRKAIARQQNYTLARIKRILDHLDAAPDHEFNARDVGEAIVYQRQVKRYYTVLSSAVKKDIEARLSHIEKMAGLKQ